MRDKRPTPIAVCPRGLLESATQFSRFKEKTHSLHGWFDGPLNMLQILMQVKKDPICVYIYG